MTQLSIGDMAPEFELPRDGGETLSLSDFSGKMLVMFFYPRDDTSGCTKEAIGFSQAQGEFEKAGAAIVGVSKDDMASHDKFVAKHDLSVPLLSDAESDLCERAGVWVEKSMYGKKFMGIQRTTLVIDGAGKIIQIWNKVKVPGHIDAVLEFVQNR